MSSPICCHVEQCAGMYSLVGSAELYDLAASCLVGPARPLVKRLRKHQHCFGVLAGGRGGERGEAFASLMKRDDSWKVEIGK